ncbi:hypothetical protein OSTOST_04530 [Ostertagia ostertagi]
MLQVRSQSWVLNPPRLISIRGPLTEPGMLYIGGYDGNLPHHLAMLSGFHGCMKKIRLNGRSIAFRPEHGQHIRECGADPCAAAGHKRQLTLSINDATPITTMAPGDSEELNVYKGLFIGGMPPDSQHLDGFRGCIEFIEIGSTVVDHPEEATTAVNIENCDL